MEPGSRLKRALVLLPVLSAGGCAGPAGAGRYAELAASPHPYALDIPVPVGFDLTERSSEDWACGPVRYVRHRYIGRGDKRALREFYREQMPLVRWTAVSDGNVHGRYTMRFERRAESCTITVAEEPSILSDRVMVDVLITPTAPGTGGGDGTQAK